MRCSECRISDGELYFFTMGGESEDETTLVDGVNLSFGEELELVQWYTMGERMRCHNAMP